MVESFLFSEVVKVGWWVRSGRMAELFLEVRFDWWSA